MLTSGRTSGLITPINDWPVNQNQFAQLTYTQTLPGNRVSISIGQYPFFNFDGNQYLGNQQQNFVNYILAQNGSATYAAAGLGAYAQWNATETFQFAGGFQYPNSASAATLQWKGFRTSDLGWFAYAQWTPKFKGLGDAQYSFTWHESPAIEAGARDPRLVAQCRTESRRHVGVVRARQWRLRDSRRRSGNRMRWALR